MFISSHPEDIGAQLSEQGDGALSFVRRSLGRREETGRRADTRGSCSRRKTSHVPPRRLGNARRFKPRSCPLCPFSLHTRLMAQQCPTYANRHTASSVKTYSSSRRWPWPGSPPRSRLETSPPGRGRCPPRNPPLRCSELDRGDGEREGGEEKERHNERAVSPQG